MQIGLLSDTHGFLDPALLQHFADCDEIWHAGDFGPVELFDELKAFKPLRAVYGNVDGAEVRASTGLDLEFECEGLRVYMTHIGGYPGRYERHARERIMAWRPGLFICGHSHILKVMRDSGLNLIHLNPGAAGHTGWHLVRTALRFKVEAGRVLDMHAIELGARGRKAQPPNSGTGE
jgi:putative phosphoesterase